MTTNEFLRLTRKEYTTKSGITRLEIRPHVLCQDGFIISIQASQGFYCEPQNDTAEYYSKVELGFPNQEDELIASYADNPDKYTYTVYPYVPVRIVDRLLEKHGGIAKFIPFRKRL